MARGLSVLGLIIVVVVAFAVIYLIMTPEEDRQSGGMGGPGAGTRPEVPPVKGYADGQEIMFIHTEASSPEVAGRLTEMMASPVLVVPALAEASDEMLARVYVFTNGIAGNGPLGYQADVFDNPPGTEKYSPLRALYQVTWVNAASARTLKSAVEVLDAEAAGAASIERTDVVVNMPFVAWADGER